MTGLPVEAFLWVETRSCTGAFWSAERVHAFYSKLTRAVRKMLLMIERFHASGGQMYARIDRGRRGTGGSRNGQTMTRGRRRNGTGETQVDA